VTGSHGPKGKYKPPASHFIVWPNGTDFKIVENCAREIVRSTVWPGNWKPLDSENVPDHAASKVIVRSDLEWTNPHTFIRVGLIPMVPLCWIAQSLDLLEKRHYYKSLKNASFPFSEISFLKSALAPFQFFS
jgi:hypothetical protein